MKVREKWGDKNWVSHKMEGDVEEVQPFVHSVEGRTRVNWGLRKRWDAATDLFKTIASSLVVCVSAFLVDFSEHVVDPPSLTFGVLGLAIGVRLGLDPVAAVFDELVTKMNKAERRLRVLVLVLGVGATVSLFVYAFLYHYLLFFFAATGCVVPTLVFGVRKHCDCFL